jgi:hypothetical protein
MLYYDDQMNSMLHISFFFSIHMCETRFIFILKTYFDQKISSCTYDSI